MEPEWALYLLAVVQAMTEFLPVSSSGHLVFMEKLLGFPPEGMQVEVVLHLATLASIVVYFRKEFWDVAGKILQNFKEAPIDDERYVVTSDVVERRWPVWIFITVMITGFIGFVMRDIIAENFHNTLFVSIAFAITGSTLLWIRSNFPQGRHMIYRDALYFGLAQGFAILPGISRSGMTIACLILLGLNRRQAFTFSFLAGAPIIAIASLYELRHGLALSYGLGATLTAMLIAFLCGLLALHALSRTLVSKRFDVLGVYCLLLSIGGVIHHLW
jgi:undecaprenyl-diphosphatase